ncbi:MAG: DUF7487 domain-containing protein [Nitrososphaeraceae archaeon]
MGEHSNTRLTTEQYIEKATLIHDGKYDYSEVNYTNTYGKIIIKCPEHGEFTQTAKDHLRGGCKKCSSIKRKQTNLDRYGVENTFQSEEKKAKIKKTMMFKYGVKHNSFNLDTIKKRKQTNLIKLGVEVPLQSDLIQEKVKLTNIQKYGVERPLQNNEVKQKLKDTNINRYGVDYTLRLPEIRVKIKQTNLERYGVNHLKQSHIPTEVMEQLNNKQWLIEQHHINKHTLSQIAKDLNLSGAQIIGHYCKKHNVDIRQFFQSNHEKDIISYIKSISTTTIINNCKSVIPPLELDIYLPDLNLAIEFNGIYWHSELSGKDRNYHLNKTQLCNNKGIRLIHIFENEWILKNDIVKSRIASLLKKNKTIYARNCKITQLSNKESNEFLEKSHIQGSINTLINYGLEYNNELVAVMTFGKSRFNKEIAYELIRFSNKLYTNVIGGASKLFQYFISQHNPTSIISYSDNRWNSGNLYEQLGFKFSHTATPNYFYFHKNNTLVLMSRQNFQKHKLSTKLSIFDIKLTEWENMVNTGYNRIWDCGNNVYVYKK